MSTTSKTVDETVVDLRRIASSDAALLSKERETLKRAADLIEAGKKPEVKKDTLITNE